MTRAILVGLSVALFASNSASAERLFAVDHLYIGMTKAEVFAQLGENCRHMPAGDYVLLEFRRHPQLKVYLTADRVVLIQGRSCQSGNYSLHAGDPAGKLTFLGKPKDCDRKHFVFERGRTRLIVNIDSQRILGFSLEEPLMAP